MPPAQTQHLTPNTQHEPTRTHEEVPGQIIVITASAAENQILRSLLRQAVVSLREQGNKPRRDLAFLIASYLENRTITDTR